VVTLLGLTALRAEFAQMVEVLAGVAMQVTLEEVWEHECGPGE
jgi:hypothetical protein